jgi:hypothetical protein
MLDVHILAAESPHVSLLSQNVRKSSEAYSCNKGLYEASPKTLEKHKAWM